MLWGLLLARRLLAGSSSAADTKGCRPRAFQFENWPDVNVEPLVFLDFGLPLVPNNTVLAGWRNNTHTDASDTGLPVEEHVAQVNAGSPAMLGTFNGTSFIGTNGVPLVVISNYTLPLPVPYDRCSLYMEAVANFKSIYPENILSCAGRANDPFYGAGLITAVDPVTTWLEFGFLMTNRKIYALYARWPNGWVLAAYPNVYTSFVYMVPVADRGLEDYNHLVLHFNRAARSVSWGVDGKRVLTVHQVGLGIDNKFLTNRYGVRNGTYVQDHVYPPQLAFELGVHTPTLTGLVKGACQGLYDPCAGSLTGVQPPTDAFATMCRYVQPQDPATWNTTMILTMQRFSVSNVCDMPAACPCSAPLANGQYARGPIRGRLVN